MARPGEIHNIADIGYLLCVQIDRYSVAGC
jgi:hypothetical protein